MIALAVWLLATGLGDLILGLSGEVRASEKRQEVAVLVAGIVGGGVFFAIGHMVLHAVLALSMMAGLMSAWIWLRNRRVSDPIRQHQGTLIFFGSVVVLSIILGPYLPEPEDSGVLHSWLEKGAFPFAVDKSPEEFFLLLGVALLQLATGNALVRLVLGAAEIQLDRGESPQLRGGRIIGPLERLLILLFVVVGKPTGAALIVAAKSFLRFPEVSKVSQSPDYQSSGTNVAVLSEYILVGSLTSWSIALFPVVFLMV